MIRTAVVILVTLTCLGLLPFLQSESDLSSALSERDASQIAAAKFEGASLLDRTAVLLVRSENLASASGLNAFSDLLFELQLLEGITHVSSVFSLPDAENGQLVLEQALSEGYAPRAALQHTRDAASYGADFLSRDLTASMVFVSGESNSLASLARTFAPCEKDTTLCVTPMGPIAIEQAVEDRLQFDNLLLTPVSAIVCLAIVAVWFGSLRIALHVIAPVLVGVIWYFGLLALLDIPIDVFNAVVPTVILTIGLADMLHLMNAVGKNHTNGDPQLALRRILPAITLTTATTAFAFASLALEGSEALQRLAFCGVAGTSLLWVAIVTIGPFACRGVASASMDNATFGKKVSSKLFRTVLLGLRSRRSIIATGAAVSLIGIFSLSWVPVDFEFTENLPDGPVAEAFETAEREGLAMAPLFVSLPSDPRDGLPAAIAVLNGGEAPDMSRVSDAIAGRDTLVLPLPVTAGMRASDILNLADNTLARLADHSDAIIDGFPMRVSEAAIEIVERLQIIFFLAIAVLATVFGVIFRSAWVTVCALFVNLLPLLAMQAAMVFSMGWINMASVVAMIVASGIVVDDTVHLLWAIRRRKIRATTHTVLEGLRDAGEPVSLTTLALICGFSISLASGLPGLQLFGALVMLSLGLAWLADMYLLPVVLIGRGGIK